MIKKIPSYVWTFVTLIFGILIGGIFPETLDPIASGTRLFINLIIKIVPILIFLALSPAVAALIKRGLAGKFAGSVILWYIASSALAGLIGVTSSALIFRIPFTAETADDKKLRIKTIAITRGSTKISRVAAVRKQNEESIKAIVKKAKFENLIQDIVNYKLQSSMKRQLTKIYPVKIYEIRFMGIEKEKKHHEEEKVGTQTKSDSSHEKPKKVEAKAEKKETKTI